MNPLTTARSPLVMIASGQEWTVRSLESVLAPQGYSVLRAFRGEQALQLLTRAQPDLFVIDTELPDQPGVELCTAIRSHSAYNPAAPVVMLTGGPATRRERIQALRAGAWETFRLPLDTEETLLKFDAYLRAKNAADIAREESLLDADTGFYNVRGLLHRIHELASEAHRSRRALACVVFTAETNAPEVTSEQAVGFMTRVLRSSGRRSDAIGRLSTTEFAVLAGGTDSEGARLLAARISRAAEKEARARTDSTAFKLQAGCFVAPNFRDAQLEPADLLIRATLALRAVQGRTEAART